MKFVVNSKSNKKRPKMTKPEIVQENTKMWRSEAKVLETGQEFAGSQKKVHFVFSFSFLLKAEIFTIKAFLESNLISLTLRACTVFYNFKKTQVISLC